jgi:hypothetical protein
MREAIPRLLNPIGSPQTTRTDFQLLLETASTFFFPAMLGDRLSRLPAWHFVSALRQRLVGEGKNHASTSREPKPRCSLEAMIFHRIALAVLVGSVGV